MAKPIETAAPPASQAFRESRIYAEGWNAARKSAPARNPYDSEPARSRWLEGYTKGQG